MASAGAQRIFIAGGRVRSVWRILLFTALFVALVWVGAPLLARAPLPVRPSPLLYQGAVTLAAAVTAGVVLLAWLDRRPPGALGFAWTAAAPREAAVGLAIGAGSLALVAGALVLSGWLRYAPDDGAAAAYATALGTDLVVLGVAAAAEEALFRGYPFQVLVEGIGPVAATLLLSAAFAAAHGANPNAGGLALVNIFLAGVLLSAAYLRTRSLWFATGVHLGWNWAMASVFDLPVSGLEDFDTPLYEPVVTGPAWITGGAFGPEGGIGAGVAFLMALAAVCWIPGLGETPAMRDRRPLVDRRLSS